MMVIALVNNEAGVFPKLTELLSHTESSIQKAASSLSLFYGQHKDQHKASAVLSNSRVTDPLSQDLKSMSMSSFSTETSACYSSENSVDSPTTSAETSSRYSSESIVDSPMSSRKRKHEEEKVEKPVSRLQKYRQKLFISKNTNS